MRFKDDSKPIRNLFAYAHTSSYTSSIVEANNAHPNGDDKNNTKHTPASKNLIRTLRRSTNRVKKSLPFKKIGVFLLIFVAIGWTSLHFYFASSSRIESAFSKNVSSISEIESTSTSISKLIETITLTSDPTELDEQFQALNSSKTATNLPRKLFVNYAYFRSSDEAQKNIEELYSIDTRQFSQDYSASTKGYQEINTIVSQLEQKKLQFSTDTDAFESYLQSSIRTFRGIEDDSVIDTKVLQKIYIVIQDSLLEYRETGDAKQFEFRYNNVSSEVMKEFTNAWTEGFINQLLPTLLTIQELQRSLLSN